MTDTTTRPTDLLDLLEKHAELTAMRDDVEAARKRLDGRYPELDHLLGQIGALLEEWAAAL